ncbi:hypothetical protein VOLCADRAFT_97123 [Volvox carteri f. nagariensis]|uniref:Uncharacterized protein n=1 Tax=Volvox carteri f. nagariensis TaxID=3068 RepID=D8UBY2_VOLCA|nr:uncharacterized protein VOLCADRAFT_97123 [Volvox carteri f. nagariensis]EFJ42699.1 hypothetical protein VOLCADRAFT_97123 [Volvox carteri f. nagariensis]|eukprot:XP_002956160.1 hypothetical protein VOLCADRAFT_97123 [Volvox carteri f. nagariensis]
MNSSWMYRWYDTVGPSSTGSRAFGTSEVSKLKPPFAGETNSGGSATDGVVLSPEAIVRLQNLLERAANGTDVSVELVATLQNIVRQASSRDGRVTATAGGGGDPDELLDNKTSRVAKDVTQPPKLPSFLPQPTAPPPPAMPPDEPAVPPHPTTAIMDVDEGSRASTDPRVMQQSADPGLQGPSAPSAVGSASVPPPLTSKSPRPPAPPPPPYTARSIQPPRLDRPFGSVPIVPAASYGSSPNASSQTAPDALVVQIPAARMPGGRLDSVNVVTLVAASVSVAVAIVAVRRLLPQPPATPLPTQMGPMDFRFRHRLPSKMMQWHWYHPMGLLS